MSHDHRSRDLHSSCPNIVSIMTGTKGISAHQVTDLPAILAWLMTLLFFFVGCHMHAHQCSNVFFVISFLLFCACNRWASRGNHNTPDKHVVLSLSGNLGLASSEPVHRSFQADQESGEFNQVWTSPADFERWHQEQHQC